MSNDKAKLVNRSIDKGNKTVEYQSGMPCKNLLAGIAQFARAKEEAGNPINIEEEIQKERYQSTLRVTRLNELIQAVADDRKTYLKMVDGVARIYNGKYWESVTPAATDSGAARTDQDAHLKYLFKQAGQFFKIDPRLVDSKHLRHAVDTFHDTCIADKHTPQPGVVLLNCNNATVEIRNDGSVNSRPHNPKDCFTYVNSYDYTPGAQAPAFFKYLDEILPDKQDRLSMQEYCGAILDKGRKYEKVLYMYGAKGRNGKSTFESLVRYVLGEDNTSTATLDQLTDNGGTGSVTRLGLAGRLVNICGETEEKITGKKSIFKDLASGTEMKIRLPHAKDDVLVPEGSYARLMFSGNHIPTFTEGAADAEARRFLFVGFNVQIPEKKVNINLLDDLKKEASGVLNWMIEGLQRLSKRGYRFSENTNSEKILQQFRENNSSVQAYINELGLVPDTKENRTKYADITPRTVKLGSLYKADSSTEYAYSMHPDGSNAELIGDNYVKFCKDTNRKPLQRGKFRDALSCAGFNFAHTRNASCAFQVLIVPADYETKEQPTLPLND